ncbi:hypothetical protein [Antribacter gilvus]|uniref:hypothetical protein n=1 Tax=Antribacter gilvus TaxID=2304675 RepID=UPI000F7B138B|nr:hypothetical protein [Antribacter gilvus]
MWRGIRRRAALVAAALTLAVTALVPVPAAAHGGAVAVALGTDGAGGVSASLTWVADGHPVEESVQVSVTATADDGSVVGPVVLASASEGVGWYRSDGGILAAGHWTLTATVSGAVQAEASTQVDVVPPPPAPEPDPAPDPGSDAGAAAAAASAPAEGRALATVPYLVGGAALLAALAAVVVLRRARVRERNAR